MTLILVSRPGAPWRIERAAEKLLLRARLPGAFVYDRVAHSLRVAEANGMSMEERFVLALPGSWMVNCAASSSVMRRWSEPPLLDTWIALAEAVKGGPEYWLAAVDPRAVVREALTALLAREVTDLDEAVSKVLALLAPESVPLMPAESVQFALGPRPPQADDGPTSRFLEMLDWFARATLEAEASLVALARTYAPCPLDAAQVLDRLLYFDSIGVQHFPEMKSG